MYVHFYKYFNFLSTVKQLLLSLITCTTICKRTGNKYFSPCRPRTGRCIFSFFCYYRSLSICFSQPFKMYKNILRLHLFQNWLTGEFSPRAVFSKSLLPIIKTDLARSQNRDDTKSRQSLLPISKRQLS